MASVFDILFEGERLRIKKKGALEMAVKMLKKGMAVDDIADVTEIPIPEIEQLIWEDDLKEKIKKGHIPTQIETAEYIIGDFKIIPQNLSKKEQTKLQSLKCLGEELSLFIDDIKDLSWNNKSSLDFNLHKILATLIYVHGIPTGEYDGYKGSFRYLFSSSVYNKNTGTSEKLYILMKDWKGHFEVVLFQEENADCFDKEERNKIIAAIYKYYHIIFCVLDELNVKFPNFKHKIEANDAIYGCINNDFFAEVYSKYDEESEDYIYSEGPYPNIPFGYLNENLEETDETEIDHAKKAKAMEIARRLLDVLDIETIAKKTKLTVKEVKELKEKY